MPKKNDDRQYKLFLGDPEAPDLPPVVNDSTLKSQYISVSDDENVRTLKCVTDIREKLLNRQREKDARIYEAILARVSHFD